MVYIKGEYKTGEEYHESFKTGTEALTRMQFLLDNNQDDEDELNLKAFVVSFEDYE